ncbi:MAG: MOSC domain-containing protein [Actinomycetota bacterium]
MPEVAGFNITPVKSTALQQPDAIDLRTEGAVGDRRFLFGRLDGSRASGVSKAPLMPIRTTWDRDADTLTLELEDGRVTGDARAHSDPIDIKLYDRTVPGRRIDPVFDAVVADIDETLTILRVDEPEYAGGVHRVSLISRDSVVTVGSEGGDPGLDPRRFRMLVEIDGLDAFAEDGWTGGRVRLGEAIVRVGSQVPRCVMTTLHPDSGHPDFPTLDVLTRTRKVGTDLLLGVYADVEEPGLVRLGDPVEPIS